MVAPAVDILLATWQGAKYLPAQLASLLAQTYPRIRILARDDGSDDGTAAILAASAAAHPDRLTVLRDGLGNQGAVGNFALLLAASSAPYRMFADQDDVWDADKASLTLAAMRAAERREGETTPLLVHTDLRVIDGDGRPVAPSLWRYLRLPVSRRATLASVLCYNDGVSGCAAMINRAMVAVATPFPAGIAMHDWYLLQVATALGRRVPVRRATMSYRLHGGNAVGLSEPSLAYVARWWRRIRRERDLAAALRQAAALWAAHGGDLAPGDAADLRAFIRLPALAKSDRWRSLAKHGFGKGWLPRDLALAALV